jgi:hypothetical protein
MCNIYRKIMAATRRRVRVGGGGPRSACPALKTEVNCKGNADCKWNAKLAKCRKAPAKRASRKHVKSVVYQAKFIEIEDADIMEGLITGAMNMNPNYKDKTYSALLARYKPSKTNGINVGDILCIMGGEYQYCIYVALPGRVEWLGDDGDTPDFVLNLLKYKNGLDKKNVKYDALFKNEGYYALAGLSSGLRHVRQKNRIVSDHLLGTVIETTMPAEIVNGLSEGGLLS